MIILVLINKKTPQEAINSDTMGYLMKRIIAELIIKKVIMKRGNELNVGKGDL